MDAKLQKAMADRIKSWCPDAPSYDMAHDLYESMLKAAPTPTIQEDDREAVAKAILALVPMGYGMRKDEALQYADAAIQTLIVRGWRK